MPLPSVMILYGCHNCRTHETKNALVADIVADVILSDFHGIFELVVHPVGTDAHEIKAERNWKTHICFAILGEVVS